MNRSFILVWSIAVFAATLPCRGAENELALQKDSKLVLASVAKGRELLGAPDEFTRELTRFDLEARLATRENATTERLLEHVTAQVLAWDEAEARQIAEALASFRVALQPMRPGLFPERVWLIKTTGRDEGGAAYCRGNAIVLPRNMIERPPSGSLARLLAHELFHILSRHNQALREELYGIVGFHMIDQVRLPASLADRKITNPDAPLVNCYISLQHDGRTFHGAPLLYADAERYDPSRGGSFFQYMQFALLEIERHEGKWRPALRDDQPVLVDPSKLPSYFEKIGNNTRYIIHPEEILAENFSLLVTGAKDLPSPQVVERLGEALRKRID